MKPTGLGLDLLVVRGYQLTYTKVNDEKNCVGLYQHFRRCSVVMKTQDYRFGGSKFE